MVAFLKRRELLCGRKANWKTISVAGDPPWTVVPWMTWAKSHCTVRLLSPTPSSMSLYACTLVLAAKVGDSDVEWRLQLGPGRTFESVVVVEDDVEASVIDVVFVVIRHCILVLKK